MFNSNNLSLTTTINSYFHVKPLDQQFTKLLYNITIISALGGCRLSKMKGMSLIKQVF